MMTYDFAIIGAGIAGASLAAELAPHGSVVILEAEAQPGYHATGRSAAFWSETYGGPGVQPLTTASHEMLQPFLSERGAIHLGQEGDRDALATFEQDFADSHVSLIPMDRRALKRHLPALMPEWTRGLHEPDCAEIDVAGLHQSLLKTAKASGALLECRAGLRGAELSAGVWQLESGVRRFQAQILINAAGAWADLVAVLANVQPLGIQPLRRTMAQLRMGVDVPHELPLVIDISNNFYFKSDGAGGLWLSPHDETPSEPCDAAPEELDIAIAIDRLEQVMDWPVRGVSHKWAGLRSFAPDRLPVYGFDPSVERYFWFAGQGGFGIQTAPAAAKIAASLLLGIQADARVAHIDQARYSPERFTI
jgi:D-arginine dehydrogenase